MSSLPSSSHKRRVNTSAERLLPATSGRRGSQVSASLSLACKSVLSGRSGGVLAIAATAALFGPSVWAQTDNTGLLGQYFNIAPANVNNLSPDFASFASLQAHLGSATPALVTDITPTLNFQADGSAFPVPYNVNAVNFESFYSGLLNIAADGVYIFDTSSDDGSMLFIDGQTVVNNNFYQGTTTRTGTITLTAGYHNIAVGYYEGNGGFGLNARINGFDLDVNNPSAKLTPDIIMRTLPAGPLALTTGNVITGQDNTDATYSGVLSGIGGVTKWGTGTLTLTGANTNTGANIVGVGTLIGHTGSLKGNIINSAALVFDQTLASPAITNGTYAGVLSGTGSVTKVNAGTVVFSGANTYTGATNINGGTLAVGPAGLGATSRVTINNSTLQATTGGFGLHAPVTVTGTGTVDTNGNDSRIFGAVDGAGSLVKTGTGTLTISDVSTYTGPTVITGGTLKLNPLQPGLNEGHLLTGQFDVTSAIPQTSITLGTPKSEASGGQAQTDFVDNTTWGYTGYIVNPASTNVTWTFAENFDDNVLLKIDGVTILNDTAWNSPTKANYTLTPGRHVIEARFGQGGGGVGPSNQGWFTGNIGFGVDMQGRNEANAANYVAVTDPGDGSLLNVGYGALPATSAVIMSNNTTLDVTSAVQTIGSLADATGGATGHKIVVETAALTIGNDNSSTAFSGAITGAGTVTKIGTGTQSLNGASTYTGATTLNAGGLNLNNASAIGTGPLVINGGSIGSTGATDITLSTNNTQTWSGNFTYTGTKNLNLGTGAVTLTGNRQVTVNSNTLTVGGVISGANASLTKAGPGILILKSPETYTGNTVVAGGTLKLENAGTNILSTSPVITVGTGATLDATGLSGGGITLTGTQTLNGAGTVLGGVTTVSGSNVSPGTGNIGVLTVGNLTLVSGAKLSYWLGGSTFGGVIAVNGNLVLPSSGLNLLLFDDANASGKGSIPAAGTYTLLTYTGSLTGFNPATTFTTQPGRSYTFTNEANKITLTLAIQSLTWTGQTGGNGAANSVWSPVPNNWANAAVATSYSDGNIVVFQDTNPANGNAPITNSQVSIASNVSPTSVTFNNSAVPYTLTGAAGISGGASITKTGTGLVRLQNTNSFTGAVTINAGAINVSNKDALGNSVGVTVANGAALQLQGGIFIPSVPLVLNGPGLAGAAAGALNNVSGSNTYNGPITLAGAATIETTAGSLELTGGVVNAGFNLTVGGAGTTSFTTGSITGAGSLTKTGTGTLILSAPNSYTGGTTISAGTVEGTSASLQGNIVNNATVIFNQALASPALTTGTYAGVMSGTGKVLKNNDGTLILTSANTYTGGTTVNGGTLALAVGGNTGTLPAASVITVNTGASLRVDATDALGFGTGSVAPLTLNGGTLNIAAGIHATLPAITMTAGTVTAAGPGDGAGNYIFDGSITTLASADPSVISAPKITLRGGAVTGSSVELNVARGTGPVDLRVTSSLSDNGNGLTKSGAGIAVLARDNNYTGGTTINGGTVVTGGRGLGSGLVTVAADATLSVSQTGNVGLVGRYFNLTPANTNNTNPNFGNLDNLRASLAGTVPALIANASTLNFETSGSGFPAPYNVSATNFQTLHTGMINIPVEGLYTFNTSSDDGSMLFIDGSVVVDNNLFQGVTTKTGTVTLAAGYHNIAVAYYQGGGGYGLNAQISGPGDLIMADLGSAAASATITPDLAISALSGAGNVSLATGNLIVGSDNSSATFGGVISGIGSVNKWGTGTQTLSGANTYSGGTNVIAGSVKLGRANALGSGPVKLSTGTTLDLDGFSQSIPSVAGRGSVVLGSGTLTLGADNSSSDLDAPLSGTGGLTKAGSGILTVNGTNSYTGPTSITGGTLRLPAATGASQPGLFEGRLAAAFDIINPIPHDGVKLTTERANSTDTAAFIDNSTWGYTGKLLNSTDSPVVATFAENFDDNVLLLIDGVRILNDTVWNVQTQGAYTLSPGYHSFELRVGQGAGGVGPAPGNNGAPGGVSGTNLGVAVSLDNGATWLPITDPGDGSLLTTGTDVSSGVPSKSSVVLSSGTTFDVNGNSIKVGSVADAAGAVSGHQVQLNGGTLNTGGDNTNTTFSGVITGAGNVTKSGTGTWTLTGANNYTGATNVKGGALLVGGSLSGTTGVNVDSFATLGGNGSITTSANGNVVLADGAKLAPGLTGTGTLSLVLGTGKLQLASAINTANSKSLLFDLGPVALSDKVVLTSGVLDIGAGVLELDDFTFTNAGGLAAGNVYTLFDTSNPISGTLGTNVSGFINGFIGTLSVANNQDIILTVSVPEPGSLALLGGAGLMLGLKRFRRAVRRA